MDFLPQGFDQVFGLFGNSLPRLIALTVILIILIISIMLWRSIMKGKLKRMGIESGMKFQDIDALRKKGLIEEDEYKKIRQALARQETQRVGGQAAAERDRRLLEEIALNPDAAFKFLTPEQQAAAKAKASAPEPIEPPRTGTTNLETPQPPIPSMNNPRVVQSRREARPQTEPATTSGPNPQPRDIDLLLAKGAITQEEYDRLKKFFE